MKTRLRYALCLVALIIAAWYGTARAEEIIRPPNDDSERSTVRVNTNWVEHSLDWHECLERARVSLTKFKYFVDISDKSVFGLKEGITVSVRCDYEGVAFVVSAFRRRPEQAVQEQIMQELVDTFE
jgi:hypothetical protein